MLLSRHLPKGVYVLKKSLFLGVFLTVLLILTACGNEDKPFTHLTIDDLKSFISEKNTGFVLYTYNADDMEANKEQVRKALEKNNKESQYFNYGELVSNEQSQTFQNDVGSKQSRDSLGYYEEGVLMAEFEFPNKWDTKTIDDLNKFIVQISE
jgi:hypothetical protein